MSPVAEEVNAVLPQTVVAATPQLLRRVNAQAVLREIRSTDVATGTELMALTGLTRASVIAVCEDLIQRGWIRELGSARDGTGSDAAARRARGRAARPAGSN